MSLGVHIALISFGEIFIGMIYCDHSVTPLTLIVIESLRDEYIRNFSSLKSPQQSKITAVFVL
jgi:hypothetical protein